MKRVTVVRPAASVREELAREISRRLNHESMNPQLVAKGTNLEGVPQSLPVASATTKMRMDSLRGALRFFLGHDLDYTYRQSLDADLFGQLAPSVASIVYWGELDDLRRHIKACAFTITASRLRSAIGGGSDVETTAFWLRQAIEVSYWALYSTYGAQIAYAQIRQVLKETGNAALIDSDELERFLRGWFAPKLDRLAAGSRAARQRVPIRGTGGQVDGNEALIDKQMKAARFFAEQCGKEFGIELATEVDSLHDAYRYLCGWVHITPLVVLSHPTTNELGELPPIAEIIASVAISAWHLQKELLFREVWANGGYTQLIGPHLDPDVKRHVRIGVYALEELRDPRKPVEIVCDNGTVLSPVPKNQQPKKPKGPKPKH